MSRDRAADAGVTVREAAPDDRLGVRRVLDAAMLDVRADLPERIAAGDVLVASEPRNGSERRVARDAPRPSDRARSAERCSADHSSGQGPREDGERREQTVEPRGDDADTETPVLGALVLVPRDDAQADGDGVGNVDRGARVDAVAVRRARRGQGVGSALVRTAAERHGRLTAEFDADVRPFYEALGFEVEAMEDGNDRFRGRYES